MCVELEAIGYQFDDFSVNESGLEITYPDGRQQRYLKSYSLNPVVVTDINRDYNDIQIFSDDEALRLERNARKFCEDYQQIAFQADIHLPLNGILYWDYIDGVRGGFRFNKSCEITGSHSWSTGSYARDYEPNSASLCPSGHVVH